MPLVSGAAYVSGDLPSEERSKLSRLLSAINRQVTNISNQLGLPVSKVRMLKPCNMAVILSDLVVYIILTNVNTSGIPSHTFIDWREKQQINLDIALQLSERDLAFEQSFGLEFPARYLSVFVNRNVDHLAN